MKLSEVATKLDDVIREVKPQLESGYRSIYGELLSLKIRSKEIHDKYMSAELALEHTSSDTTRMAVRSLAEEYEVAENDVCIAEQSYAAIKVMLDDCNNMIDRLQNYMLCEFVNGSNPELDGAKR